MHHDWLLRHPGEAFQIGASKSSTLWADSIKASTPSLEGLGQSAFEEELLACALVHDLVATAGQSRARPLGHADAPSAGSMSICTTA